MFRALLDSGAVACVKTVAALAIASRCDLGSEMSFEQAEADCAGGLVRRLKEINKKEIIYIDFEKEFDDAPPADPYPDAFNDGPAAGSARHALPYAQDVWPYHHTAGVHTNPRAAEVAKLRDETYDLLVIGAGITGAGAALEATKRGLKVALIDKGDFASCTSSKSTKLIHGGVRYLEQAFTQLDPSMISLVKEALHERAHMLTACNYMNSPVPILIPINTWWEIPYMWVGVKLYEFYARGHRAVPRARVLNAEETHVEFPSLRSEGIKGSIVYYDGQMNDARYTLTVALSAKNAGATVANYVRVDALTHHTEPLAGPRDTPKPTVAGAVVTDVISGESFPIRAAAVLNATGPFADVIRKMDDPSVAPLVVHSAGVHVALPAKVCPPDTGMLIPKTKDGRLLFCLPWEGGVVAGTTDAAAELTDDPIPTAADVDFIIDALNDVLETPLTRDDVLSVWAGLRPLVRDPSAGASTSKLSRQHVITASPTGLVSVMGGKFTTYRSMGEEAIDKVRETHPKLAAKSDETSPTRNMLLQGAFLETKKYQRLRLVLITGFGMSAETADYLIQNYGDRARVIAAMSARQAQEELAAATALPAHVALTRALARLLSPSAIYGNAVAAVKYLNPLDWARWYWQPEYQRAALKKMKRDARELDRMDRERNLHDDPAVVDEDGMVMTPLEAEEAKKAHREAKAEQRRNERCSPEERERRRSESLDDKRRGVYHIKPISFDRPAPRGSRVKEDNAEVGKDALLWRERVRRLAQSHPALESEVVYAVKYEMAQTVTDVLARRIRMGFTDAAVATDAIGRTAELMGPRLGWDAARTQREVAAARQYFGAMDYRHAHAAPVTAQAAAEAGVATSSK